MSPNTKAVIFSVEGLSLNLAECDLFREARPFGFILFGRNCETLEQVSALTAALRDCVGWDCPILIDQEGGRVQRLKPPHWRAYPAAQTFGDIAQNNLDEALETLRFVTLQMAQDLRLCGIDVNCAPVLDVLCEATHEAIGDRAFSEDPDIVARLGLCVARNYLAAGITPVIKHLPGHGRASLDSHHDLPVVTTPLEALIASDFQVFKALSSSPVSPALWGMAAHIIYTDIDPDHPSSVSPKIIHDIIRGEIGFDGLLLSDDLDMKALSAYGDVAQRCAVSLEAGCDIALYCSGKLDDMRKIAKSVPNLSKKALARLQSAEKFNKMPA